MTVVNAYPPNIDEIRARFNPPRGTIYAYGDTIYAPDSGPLPADLIAHEEVHFVQQRRVGGPEAWWRRYIDDARFRLEQEVEAYRVQWAIVRDMPRPERRARLQHICRSLSSRMYGGIVTYEQARKLVTGATA